MPLKNLPPPKKTMSAATEKKQYSHLHIFEPIGTSLILESSISLSRLELQSLGQFLCMVPDLFR